MFEELIHLIEQHPTYSSAMRNAIARNLPLVLNYHTHQGEGTGPERLDGQSLPILELAHVQLAGCYSTLLGVRDAVDGK